MPQDRMKSVDARRFAMVPRTDVPRSAFDVMHTHKTTFNVTYLTPVYVDEVLPGDSVRLKMSAFARLSTPIVPVMDNLILESFFFFVPNRLVWDTWERFMGERASVTDTTTFLVPQVVPTQAQATVATLYDYMGITLNAANSLSVSALPFRAYNKIWNDFFRDQDLFNPAVENIGNGPDAATDYQLLPRCKRHDYFTSARPWPQKPTNAQQGVSSMDPQLPGQRFLIPPQGTPWPQIGAPVVGIGVVEPRATGAASTVTESMRSMTQSYTNTYLFSGMRARAAGVDGNLDIKVLVNDIRQAMQIQRMMEINARGGTRYAEIIRAHFGVISPDARLQRPEYLGGGRSFVTIHPLAQTSASDLTGSTTNLGEQAGIGTVAVYDHGFSQSFTEHGTIIGMVNVRADLTYQQGVERMWFRRTQFDYYWPSLAHLGEQTVQLKELYATGVAADDDSVFGYQERWSEYKYKPSRTSGYFRSTVATPLDMWHFGQNFSPAPVLNSVFVTDVPPVNRALQVSVNFGQQFLMDSLFEVRKVRPMPMYSIPGLGPRL